MRPSNPLLPPPPSDLATLVQPDMAPVAGPASLPGYAIEGELGRGGMGVVYKARQAGLDRPVALKFLLAGPHTAPEILSRFQREAQVVARLRHPNVVQVYEVGTWQAPDGSALPYLALEYVAGGTLSRLLAGQPQAPRKAAEVVATLARAVHFAHQQRVLHRDLKPANVLLDHDGTLKVTDFGLARWLPDPIENPAFAPTKVERLTQTGQVLGTPSYMAPEQAGGVSQNLGPAVDVWALGAILYECLTGRPPFLASSSIETLLLVLSAEPVPPRRLNPTVPRDLETVCLKCLEKQPGKRYPTAQALAEDLERFLQGRPIVARPVGAAEKAWKWARRHPAGAALLALLAAVLAGLAAGGWAYGRALKAHNEELRISEEKERAARVEAEANLELARQAVGDTLEELTNLDLSRPGAQQPAVLAALRRGLGYYQAIVARAGADPASRPEVAEARLRIAQITGALGTYDEAVRAYEEAVRSAWPLAEAGEARDLYRLAMLHLNLGGLHARARHTELAAKEYQRALSLAGPLARVHPQRPAYRVLQVQVLNNQGILLEKAGDVGRAEGVYREGITAARELLRADPRLAHAHLLAQLHNNLGLLYLDQRGQPKEALSELRAGLELLEQVAGEKPLPRELSLLGRLRHNVASCHAALGERQQAEAEFREALRLRAEVADAEPHVVAHQAELAQVWNNLGRLELEHGLPREAVRHLERALSIQEALARVHREEPAHAKNLAAMLLNLATALDDLDRPAEARPLRKRALEVLEPLAGPGSEPSSRDLLARILNNMGRRAPTLAEEEALLKRALRVQGEVIREAGPLPARRHLLGTIQDNLAELYRRRGRADLADGYYREAQATLAEVVREVPGSSTYRAHLAQTHNNFGSALRSRNRLPEARRSLRAALTLANPVATCERRSASDRNLLGRILLNLGSVEEGAGRPEEARAWYRRALDVVGPLVQECPDVAAYADLRARLLHNVGSLERDAGRLEEAEALYQQALAIQVPLVDGHPHRPDYAALVAQTHRNRARAFARAGRWSEEGQALEAGAEVLEKLTLAFADRPDLQTELVRLYLARSLNARRRSGVEAELPWLDRGVAAAQRLVERFGAQEGRDMLRVLSWARAEARGAVGRDSEALADWDRALELSAAPSRGRLFLGRARCDARLGNHARALAVADGLPRQKAPGDVLFGLACVYARCAEVVRKDEGVPLPVREKMSGQCTRKAVQMLRRAEERGYFRAGEGPERLRGERDLDAMRGEEGFREVAARAGKRG